MDFFNFDWSVKVYNEFKPEREYIRIQDISYGQENFAVSCVNSLDKNYPEYVEYSRIRIPQSNVKINTGKKYWAGLEYQSKYSCILFFKNSKTINSLQI